jgi:hypothetical protein
MTNPRTVEFERKIRSMFRKAHDLAVKEATEKGISPYDVKIDFEYFIEDNQTENNDATPEPTKRAFKNLERRMVFIEDTSERERTFHLNPKLADQDVFIDKSENIWFHMPKSEPKPKTEG